jgi:hypothetical protein
MGTKNEPVEKYRMVDNPDGSGTKVREYFWVDPDTGDEVDAPAGATERGADAEVASGTTDDFAEASAPREQEERLTDAEAEERRRESLEEAMAARKEAEARADAERKAMAEAAVAHIGQPEGGTDIEGEANLAASAEEADEEDDEEDDDDETKQPDEPPVS